MELTALSSEYVKVSVAAVVNGVLLNPTADSVYHAYTLHLTEPLTVDWVQGDWETVPGNDGLNPVYYARVLVGPKGKRLDPGTYSVWVKITDNPEAPVRRAGLLKVTGRKPYARDGKVRFRLV